MSALPVLIALSLAAAPPAPAQVTVQPGESLAQVARRTLGDASAAGELAAFNGLASPEVKPGTTIRIPGRERELALSALHAARNAVSHAGANSGAASAANAGSAAANPEATRKLAHAEELFAHARYQDAAKAADGAWQLVSGPAHAPTRFTVTVADGGKTQVKAHSGKPVRVEAEGVATAVYAGQAVDVEKGQAPQRLEETPPAPLLVSPEDDTHLKLRATEKGVGPVLLSWKPVDGAKGYEVTVERAEGKGSPVVVKSSRPEVRIGSLPEGRYLWSVRALGEKTRSELSARRAVELSRDPVKDALKLEVKGASWK